MNGSAWRPFCELVHKPSEWGVLRALHGGAKVILNLRIPDAAAVRLRCRSWQRERSSQGGIMTKRILVVEDQADNMQILRDLLTSADYEMIEAQDGLAGVEAAKAHRPDLILMDIQLPVLDGYEATRRIKGDPTLRAIPIIVVTSYALGGDENKARAAGCDDYVPKPYSPRQLLAKIREYLPLEVNDVSSCYCGSRSTDTAQ
jgi:two-component system cell cycle response regulator DivK